MLNVQANEFPVILSRKFCFAYLDPVRNAIVSKMKRIPHNGHLEIWLQRVTKAKGVGLSFESSEPICRIVDGEQPQLWNNDWISSQKLVEALDVSKLLSGKPEDYEPVPDVSELSLFRKYAEFS